MRRTASLDPGPRVLSVPPTARIALDADPGWAVCEDTAETAPDAVECGDGVAPAAALTVAADILVSWSEVSEWLERS